ncbi:MAG: transposase [Myxococcota bacterium]|nr:transposase [Myxococcota bacterium]
MALDYRLDVLSVYLRAVRGRYRKQGKKVGIKACIGGSVTFAQRFGSALNLNLHFHAHPLGGVFNTKNTAFHLAPPLKDKLGNRCFTGRTQQCCTPYVIELSVILGRRSGVGCIG